MRQSSRRCARRPDLPFRAPNPVSRALLTTLDRLRALPLDQLLAERYRKYRDIDHFRAYGVWQPLDGDRREAHLRLR
ncbi:MAG: hypothetical protein MUQ65_13280 [Armatimonadetes bacterium]|nr:hypothetical protein [Armatimonadota bacterium]